MPSWKRPPMEWQSDAVHCSDTYSLYFRGGESGVYVVVQSQGWSNDLHVEWGRFKDTHTGRPTDGLLHQDGSVTQDKGSDLYPIFRKAEDLYQVPWEEEALILANPKRIGRMLRPVLTSEQVEEKKKIVFKEQLSKKYRVHEAIKKLGRWDGVRVVEYWPGGYADLLVTEYISESDKAVLLKIPFQGGQVMKWFPKSQIARRMSKPDGIIWASVWIMKKLGLMSPTGRRL